VGRGQANPHADAEAKGPTAPQKAPSQPQAIGEKTPSKSTQVPTAGTPSSVSPPKTPTPEKPPVALVGGKEVPATRFDVVHHGTTKEELGSELEHVLKTGLPLRKGTNRDLVNHVEGEKDSAFRGATILPGTPDGEGGAIAWAGEGGVVFRLRRVWGWDANKESEGRRRTAFSGFAGNPAHGEHEITIDGHQSPSKIEGYFIVETNRSGRLIPGTLIPNPFYQEGKDGSH